MMMVPPGRTNSSCDLWRVDKMTVARLLLLVIVKKPLGFSFPMMMIMIAPSVKHPWHQYEYRYHPDVHSLIQPTMQTARSTFHSMTHTTGDKEGGKDDVTVELVRRRRWKRRRKTEESIAPALVSTIDATTDAHGKVTDENHQKIEKSSTMGNDQDPSSISFATIAATTSTTAATTVKLQYCPIISHSRKFPRYRISLTYEASKNEESEQRRKRRLRRGFITKLVSSSSSSLEANSRSNGENGKTHGQNKQHHDLWNNLLQGWKKTTNDDTKQTRTRTVIEALYQKEIIGNRFRWMSSSTTTTTTASSISSSSSSKSTPCSNGNAPDEDFYAIAAFWRMASDVVSAHFAPSDDNDDEVKDIDENSNWYLALPETTSTVAQNLCDILNWYTNYTIDQHNSHRMNDGNDERVLPLFLLHAHLDTRVSSSSSSSSNDGTVTKIPIVHFHLVHQSQEILLKQKQEGEDLNQSLVKRRQEQKQQQQQQQQQQHGRKEKMVLIPTPEDTERRTKAWVKRVLVQLGICPFTKSDVKSGQGLRELGVPVANIMYRHSSACGSSRFSNSKGGIYLLMADAWEAISDMVAAGPTSVSSILLSAPGFDDDFELWAGPIFAMLETCVGAIHAEEIIGIVCFHPKYVTPDGTSWPGFGHMHSVPRLKQWYTKYTTKNDILVPSSSQVITDDEIAAGGAWQRRTPHAVINVLRAEQLEAAEGRRQTGELYGRNIHVLMGSEGVGVEKLTNDLERERCM